MYDDNSKRFDQEETDSEIAGTYTAFMYHTEDMKNITLTFCMSDTVTPSDFMLCLMDMVDTYIAEPENLFANSTPLGKN